MGEEAIQWLSRFRDLHLSDEEARALVAAREQGAIDNAMYRELNRVDTLAASGSRSRKPVAPPAPSRQQELFE